MDRGITYARKGIDFDITKSNLLKQEALPFNKKYTLEVLQRVQNGESISKQDGDFINT
jgi:hypothetical protein